MKRRPLFGTLHMALHAIGWLSSKLGVDIGGRDKAVATKETDGVLSTISGAVFGDSNRDPACEGQPSTPSTKEAVGNDGLPQTRDWYFYDETKKRWEPTPHAPDWVKAEHAAKLAAEAKK